MTNSSYTPCNCGFQLCIFYYIGLRLMMGIVLVIGKLTIHKGLWSYPTFLVYGFVCNLYDGGTLHGLTNNMMIIFNIQHLVRMVWIYCDTFSWHMVNTIQLLDTIRYHWCKNSNPLNWLFWILDGNEMFVAFAAIFQTYLHFPLVVKLKSLDLPNMKQCTCHWKTFLTSLNTCHLSWLILSCLCRPWTFLQLFYSFWCFLVGLWWPKFLLSFELWREIDFLVIIKLLC